MHVTMAQFILECGNMASSVVLPSFVHGVVLNYPSGVQSGLNILLLRQPGSRYDCNSIAVVRSGSTVGHLEASLAIVISIFMARDSLLATGVQSKCENIYVFSYNTTQMQGRTQNFASKLELICLLQ